MIKQIIYGLSDGGSVRTRQDAQNRLVSKEREATQ
jgi:hypothetical protein